LLLFSKRSAFFLLYDRPMALIGAVDPLSGNAAMRRRGSPSAIGGQP
jgi:hypothetical protein